MAANSTNSFQVITMIANRCLFRLTNSMAIASRVTRDWDTEFGQRGRKIGANFYIRKPPRYIAYTGGADITGNISNYTDPTTVTLALNQRAVVPISIPSSDYLLNFDNWNERFVDPAVDVLANQVDNYLATIMYQGAGNMVGAGGTVATNLYSPTPGTSLTATSTTGAYKAFLGANAKLHKEGMPTDGRVAILDPNIQVELLSQLTGPQYGTVTSGAFGAMPGNPTTEKMFLKGKISDMSGIEWAMDQNAPTYTSGTLGGATAALLNGVPANGATTIVTDGWTASTATVNAGDVITLFGTSGAASATGNLLAVNPLSKTSTGEARQFVVTATTTADGAGAMTIPISPAIFYTSTDGRQNVSTTPVDNGQIFIYGAHATTYASKTFANSLLYHPKAVGLACVELPLYEGVMKAARATDPETGLSVRVSQFVDGYKDEFVMRLDILYGASVLYPEGICRVQTT